MTLIVTLQDLFGENAQLTDTQLIISKADLAKVGLDKYPNHLSAIFAGLFLIASGSFEGDIGDENNNIIVDGNDHSIGYSYNRVSEELAISLESTYSINNKKALRYHVSFFSGQ